MFYILQVYILHIYSLNFSQRNRIKFIIKIKKFMNLIKVYNVYNSYS